MIHLFAAAVSMAMVIVLLASDVSGHNEWFGPIVAVNMIAAVMNLMVVRRAGEQSR